MIDVVKRIVKRTPIIRGIARAAMRQMASRRSANFNSADYWEQRYQQGRNSGPGSYSKLAEFKAATINRFIAENGVRSVIEFGCGDGSQLKLGAYPSYIGVDVSRSVLQSTRDIFRNDPSKTFIHSDDVAPDLCADLSMSLDVVYHLVEDAVFDRYMTQLFQAATRFVIIYSSNDDRRSDSVHVRHRKFTDWIERNRTDFRQTGFIENPYPENFSDPETSFADFYFFAREVEANQK